MVKIPSFKKISYKNYHKELLRSFKFVENIKMGFSVLFIILAVAFYGYFVNIASTKGYFVKVEREKLSEVKFQNEIVKIDIRKKEGEIMENILPDNLDIDNIDGKVIVIKNVGNQVVYLK